MKYNYKAIKLQPWLAFITLLFLGNATVAQTTISANWNFLTASPSTTSLGSSGLVIGDFTIGNSFGTVAAPIGSISASSGYSGATGGNNIGNAARTGALNTASGSGSAYFEVTLTPGANTSLSLQSINFGTRSTGTGPQAYTIRSSADNFATDLATGSIANNSAWSLKSNTFSTPIVSTSPLTIRIYGYNGSGSAASGTINWRLDDVAISGTVTQSTSLTVTNPPNFGNVCVGQTSATSASSSFLITGSSLTNADVTVGPSTNLAFSTTEIGAYTSSLSIPQPGGSFSQTVFVRWTPSVAGAFNATIPVSGGGASTVNASASGTGINTPPSVTTAAPSNTLSTAATLNATSAVGNCESINDYGFVYSTTSGFAPATGTVAAGSNLSSGSFSLNLANLTANTTYYYRAFVNRSSGTVAYGNELSFTTLPLAATIQPSTASVSALNYVIGNGPSTAQSFQVSGDNLTGAPGNITISGSTNFEVSTTSSTSGFGQSASLPFSSATLAPSTIWIRLKAGLPTGNYNGETISITGGGASNTVTASGTVTAGTVVLSVSGSPLNHGNVCVGTVGSSVLYTITNSGNAPAANIQVVSNNPEFIVSNLSGTSAAANGGTVSYQVSFSPATSGSKSADITISADAPSNLVTSNLTGTGVLTLPVLTTGAATNIAANAATLPASITALNCGTISAYGIEYGTSSTLTSGTTLLAANNLSGNNFSAALTGLATNTQYYYRAYATTENGTSNGAILSFTTANNLVTAVATATYAFTSGTGAATTASGNGTGISFGVFTSGNSNGAISQDINSTSASSGYTGASGTNNIATAARTGALVTGTNGSAYFQVTITPATNSFVAITGISFGSRSTGTGPLAYTIRTSLDNYASNVGTPGTLSSNSTWSLVTAALNSAFTTSFTNQPITLRIYGYNGTGSPGAGTANWRIDDITIATSATLPPSLTASALAGFGNICLNQTSPSDSFTITGTNLTSGNLKVGPLNGYSFDTTLTGSYNDSLFISQNGGPSFVDKIYVRLRPTAAQAYNGNIAISGGSATAINVAASGTGIQGAPTLTTATATQITPYSATVGASNVQTACGTITNYGVEYSTVNNFTTGSGTTVNASNLTGGAFSVDLNNTLQPATTYYYRAFATNSNSLTTWSAQQSFTTINLAPFIGATALDTFYNQCVGTTSGNKSFILNGQNLTADSIVVGPLASFKFATSSNGLFADSLIFTQSGGTFNQTVFVRFTPSTAGTTTSSIPVSGGGTTNPTSVPVVAYGVNTLPVTTTGAVSNIQYNQAVATATVDALNCGTLLAYGFEYSTDSALTSPLQAFASGLTGSIFTTTLSNLFANQTYYYRSFINASNGNAVGQKLSFTTANLLAPANLDSSAVNATGFTLNWGAVPQASGYSLDISTTSNFIGALTTLAGWNFTTPSKLASSGIVANSGIASLNSFGNPGVLTFGTYTGSNGLTARIDTLTNGVGTKGWETSISTVGYYSIKVSSIQRSSNTGPRDFKLQYRVGNSGAFTDITGATVTLANDNVTGVLNNISLPADANNQPVVWIRWVINSNTSVTGATIGITGATNIDDIVITGNLPGFITGYNGKQVLNNSEVVTGLDPATTYYARVRATNPFSTSANSNVFSVTTKPCLTPTISTVVTDAGCVSASDGAINLVLTGGSAPFQFSWTGPNGYTAATEDISNLFAGNYNVQVLANGGCTTSASATVGAASIATASVAIAASDTTICSSTPVTFTATPTNGGTNPTYQWYVNSTPVTGATTNTYVSDSLSDFDVVYVTLTSSLNCVQPATVPSNDLTMQVTNTTSPSVSIDAPTTICARTQVSLQAIGTNVGSNPIYTWTVNGNVVSGVTGSVLSLDSIRVFKKDAIEVTVSNISGACSAASTVSSGDDSLQAVLFPYGNIRNFKSLSICPGDSSLLGLVNPAFADAADSYQWMLNGANIPGAVASTYAPTTAGSYQLVTTSATTGCVFTSTPRVILAKPLPPVPTIYTPATTVICGAGSIMLETDSVAGYLYRWQRDGAGLGRNPTQAAGFTGSYTVRVTMNGCSSVSAPIQITKLNAPDVTVNASGSLDRCSTDGPVTLNAVADPTYTYQWTKAGVDIPGATTNAYTATTTGGYRVRISSIGCNNEKRSLTQAVRITPTPTATITTLLTTSTSVDMRANALANATYQWFLNGNPITGATDRNYTATVSGSYTVQVEKFGCSALSQPRTVTLAGSVREASVASEWNISVYPNPSDGVFHIASPITVNASVKDLQGRTIMKQNAANDIDLSGYAAGIYLLEITDESGKMLEAVRLVKQ